MKRLALALGLLFILGFCGQAFAEYSIIFNYVQHRVYEDPNKGAMNRLYFQIKDGDKFVTEDLLTSVRLLNPKKEMLELTGKSFTANDLGMWPWYDASTGQWMWDGQLHDESGYSFTINTINLTKGTYRLAVTYNEVKLNATFSFNGLVKLPVIASSTIKTNMDSKGNVFATWKIPRSAFYLTDSNPTLAVSTRPVIDVFSGETYVGYVQSKVPIHMGQAFFPKKIIDELKTLGGDTYRFRVQIRSNDNNNRTYSDYADLSL